MWQSCVVLPSSLVFFFATYNNPSTWLKGKCVDFGSLVLGLNFIFEKLIISMHNTRLSGHHLIVTSVFFSKIRWQFNGGLRLWMWLNRQPKLREKNGETNITDLINRRTKMVDKPYYLKSSTFKLMWVNNMWVNN